MFDQVLKQVGSFAVKLPLGFPSLIYGILINQKPHIVSSEDIVCVGSSPLSFSYRLFSRSHVPYINVPNIHFDLTNEGERPEVPPLSGIAKSRVLLELMQVSKSLYEVIMTSTVCQNKADEMIKMMVPIGVKASTFQVTEKNLVRLKNLRIEFFF